jgi:hypothetical protein
MKRGGRRCVRACRRLVFVLPRSAAECGSLEDVAQELGSATSFSSHSCLPCSTSWATR